MTLELSEGQDFSSRYSLLHRIASTNSMEVWLALDSTSSERVCLNIFESKAGIENELRASIQKSRGLIHSNIVRSYDTGSASDALFYTSAYIKGTSPFDLTNSTFTRQWPVLEQLFAALQFAHSLGIHHGHLHPGNLLIDEQNQLHITGFSLPLALYHGDQAYMSPELKQGQVPHISDDIYSLGCILFHLLTDRKWHDGETFESNSPIPAIVQQSVSAMLDPSPYSRPGDLTELKQTFSDYANGTLGAKPIEIPQANFSRAATPQAETIVSESTHRLHRERNLVSSTTVVAGLALLLLVAGLVFFVLPTVDRVPSTISLEPQSGQHTTKPTQHESVVQEVGLAPLEIAQLEFLKEEGKRVASLLIRKQVELEDVGILIWGEDIYAKINLLAESGDSLYRDKAYQFALESYERALQQLKDLEQTIPDILQKNISTGEMAFLSEDVAGAIAAWSIASAIEPRNMAFNDQLLRAENLQTVLDIVNNAEFEEREQLFESALNTFREAARQDPNWQPAIDGINRIKRKLAETRFSDAMSLAFTALAGRQYAESRSAFADAQMIFPESAEPADGLLQIDLAERMDMIGTHRLIATELEKTENWAGVIQEYETILGLDQSLVFANTGLANAAKQQSASAELDKFLEEPTLMLDDAEFSAAKSALIAASRIRPSGPILKSKLSTLSRLISVARIRISIELKSDNKTEVTIYKVGNFGKISSAEVELFPGMYTIVGKRRGYRAVRHELTLLAGEPVAPVLISCTEKI
ncbi:MAG: hypothetical protein VB957_08400 [Pseudomonadales bacterium]